MDPEILIFMPNGDVTLTLIRNVYEEEAVVEAEEAPVSTPKRALSDIPENPIEEAKQADPEDLTLEDILEDESLLFYAPEPPNGADGPFFPPSPRRVRGSDASSKRDRSSSPPASFWAALKRQQATRNNEAIEEEEEERAGTGTGEEPAAKQKPVKKERVIASSHEVHCVVSSRHMILASQVFENLLAGNSIEAKTLRATGQVKIPIVADVDTVIILLNIIHGPSRKVPRQVTLEELSNLATLVSNFGMVETVQFFSDTWIDALQRDGLPKSYTANVWRLLFVFWVFDRPEEFKNMTRLAQRECDENLTEDMKSVPIPHNIIDAIKREREYAIETAITIIHTLITRYMDGQTICDASLEEDLQYACDAMVLGSLMKSSRKIGLWPRPEAPFAGRRFKDLARAIRGIKILDVCNRSSRRFASLGTSGNCHGLEDELEAALKGLEAGLDGLVLLEYAKKSDDLSSGLQMFVLAPEEEEVVPPVKENGVHEAQPHLEETPISEPPKEEPKPVEPIHSLPENRVPTPHQEIEEPTQEGVSLALHQPYDHETELLDSRTSSRASDYQVQEPVIVHAKEEQKANVNDYQVQEPAIVHTKEEQKSIASDYRVQEPVITHTKEEQKPAVSRNSPSQEWMNPGRVFPKAATDVESVRKQEPTRPQVVEEKEDLKPSVDRVLRRSSPIAKVSKDEDMTNGNGYGSGHGTSNGNGLSKPGYPTLKPSLVEADGGASRVQNGQALMYAETSRVSENISIDKRMERTSSQDRASYSSQKATHTEKISTEKRTEKPSSNEGGFYLLKSLQPEQSSFPESVSHPERIQPEVSSPTAKKTTPPELPVVYSQRSSYPAQPSLAGKPSQPNQSAPRSEKASYSERKLHNGNSSQPEPVREQNSTPSEVPTANPQVEKQSHSSHQSYNKKTETSQPQQKSIERERPAPQADRAPQNSQPSYKSKSSQPEISQAQQRTSQTDKPVSIVEKSSYTSQSSSNSRSSQPETSHSKQNSPSPQLSQASISPPPQQPAKLASENAGKETTPEGSTTLSEIDENWGQPQKFNMRKSKKKFSTRF